MTAQEAGYQTVQAVINLIYVFWPIVGPFVIMGAILGFVKWAAGLSVGSEERE